jgi:DNA-binding SARP family transcriptional activator/tetratricopeptide (TPR) repeat protein
VSGEHRPGTMSKPSPSSIAGTFVAPAIEVRLLGLPAWRTPGGDWRSLATLDAVLLCALAFEGDQRQDDVAKLLSSNDDREQAHASLRQRIHRLRRTCGGHRLFDTGLNLHLLGDVAVDICAAHGTPARDFGVDELFGATDFRPERHALAAWVQRKRAQWRERRQGCLTALADSHAAAGDLRDATTTIERALAEDPTREDRVRRLMTWQAQLGEPVAAARSFARCSQALLAQGRNVERETAELAAQIEREAPLPQRNPALPLALRNPAPFVGRGREGPAMAAAWEQRRAFVLVGEAGIGKTRLLSEFSAAQPGVLHISARPGDQEVAHSTTLRWLTRCVDHFKAPTDVRHRRELSRLLADLGPPPQAPGHEGLLQAALQATLKCAHDGGLRALLVDNAHFADAASMRALLGSLEDTSGLLFGFALRGPAAGSELLERLLASSAHPVPIHVGALGAAEVAELLRRLALPGFEASAHAASKLERHCGGNPYFVLETLRELARLGGWKEPLPVPASVEALLAQSLQLLPPPALMLARVAAIAGPDFDRRLAAEATSLAGAALDSAWHALEAEHVLEGDGFAHDLVHETVRRTTPTLERQRIHAAVANCLHGRNAAPERIADHHASAEQWPQAAEAIELAAARALRLGHHGAALANLDAAALWFDRSDLRQRGHLAGIKALLPCLMHKGAASASERAQHLFAAATGPAERAEVEAERARIALWAGDTAEAERAGRAAILGPCATPRARALAQAALAVALGWQARTAEALAVIEPVIARIDEIADPALRQGMWSAYGFVLTHDERWARGEDVLKIALAEAQRIDDASEEADAMANLGAACFGLGRANEAAAWAGHAMRLYALLGNPLGQRNNEMNLATFLCSQGQFAEAITLLSGVIQFAIADESTRIYRFTAEDCLAEVWLALGRIDRALPLLAQDPPDEPPVRRLVRSELRARAATAAGDQSAAPLWHAALAAVEPVSSNPTRRLRTRLNATLAMAAPAALERCNEALDEARQRASPVIELLALMRRVQARIRQGSAAQARPDVEAALHLARERRHLFVPRVELLWTAAQVLEAAGAASAAADCVREARRWLIDASERHVPADCRVSFLEVHAVHRALLAMAARE